jgi:hypothetical protein
MKRPVSLVASLAFGLGTLTACGAAVGKPQVAEVCSAKMGGGANCTCFVDAIEKGLTPEEFATFAKGVYDNKDYAGLLPGTLSNDPKISGVVANASNSCFN